MEIKISKKKNAKSGNTHYIPWTLRPMDWIGLGADGVKFIIALLFSINIRPILKQQPLITFRIH